MRHRTASTELGTGRPINKYKLEPVPCYYCSTIEGEPELHPYTGNCPLCTFTKINTTNNNKKQTKDIVNTKIHLSLSTKELVDGQCNDIFCTTILKLINEKKASQVRYFINDEWILKKFVREDVKIFYTLVIPWTLTKYIIFQMQDTLGHNCTARRYWYLKWMYYRKELWKDVDTHVKMYELQTTKLASTALCTITFRSVSSAYTLIMMDLISKFKLLPKGYHYPLTIIQILTY